MKINEIIVENMHSGKLRKGTRYALSNVHSYPYLNNNVHPYIAYRFGLALAASPDPVVDTLGPIGSEFVTVGYSSADQEIIDHARKEFGLTAKKHSGKGSVELELINKVSPVAKPKRNKYGV